MSGRALALFEGYGIEIETAVVDRDTLDVRTIADEALRAAAGSEDWVEDHDDGEIGWSNELVAHVVELKNRAPVPGFAGLDRAFQSSLERMGSLLAEGWNARPLPTAMHPWMDPTRETRLWPHESAPIYRAYDELFDCRRHGWSNLQSVHLNLSFSDEHEFGRLMAAVRLVLALIPALAASSPIVEGRATGLLDNRLAFYRDNSKRVRSMTGEVIPEPIYGIAEYEERVLGAIDRELGSLGVTGPLRGGHMWTNARGAIARFDRMAVEIRLIDRQECVRADLALACAVSGLVRALVEECFGTFERQRAWSGASLESLLAAAVEHGPAAAIRDADLLRLFRLPAGGSTLGELWRAIAPDTFDGPVELEESLAVVLEHGTLAERILRALGRDFDRAALRERYRDLCECSDANRSFRP